MENRKPKDVSLYEKRWFDRFRFSKPFSFYVELDLEKCASSISKVRYPSEVRIKPLAPSYKFKTHLRATSPKAFGPEAYIIGQLHPIPNMTGTQVIGISHKGLSLPVISTFMFLFCLFGWLTTWSLEPGEEVYVWLLAVFTVLLPWTLIIFSGSHLETAKNFETYLKEVETKSLETQANFM